jgi:hypothetical protein
MMAPPTGLILQIDGAATYTADLLVDLTISATGATEMSFSNSGYHWSSWEPFNTQKLAWDLRSNGGNDNEGIKTVWVRARNALAEQSSTYASIEYRRAKPSLKIYPAPVQRAGNGPVDIPLVLYDPHFNPVHVVQAEYTLDGTFTDGKNISFLPNDSAHDGVVDLSTAPNGIAHNLVWDPSLDLEEPDVSDIAQVRIKVAYANELSELALSQQFFVDTREDIELADLRFTRDDSAEIKLVLLDRNGEPFDATGDVEVTSIKDPSGNEMLTSTIIASKTSTGYYTAVYSVPNSAPLGLWLSKWEYTADYVDHEETVYFSVIEETTPYAPSRPDTCVVYGQLLNADQSPIAETEVHFLPHHISDPEYGNPTQIGTDPVIVYTDEDGKFHVELIKNTEVIIHIPKLSFRQFAKVPDGDTSEFRAMMTLLPVPPRDQFGNRI